MRDHLCQILAHYVLYLGWRLNLPIPHDAEPFILRDAQFQWHKKGLFEWAVTVEDEAEESLNNTDLDTGFSPEMTLVPPWQWIENSQTISMDQFGLNSEEHMVVDVPLCDRCGRLLEWKWGPPVYERGYECGPKYRKTAQDFMEHEKNLADSPDSELLTAEGMRTRKHYLLV